jgi:hypothetical protein
VLLDALLVVVTAELDDEVKTCVADVVVSGPEDATVEGADALVVFVVAFAPAWPPWPPVTKAWPHPSRRPSPAQAPRDV